MLYLVLLAIGFVHPEHDGLINNLKIELDQRGNVSTKKTIKHQMLKYLQQEI